jgi:hypothetical protein
VTIVAEPRLKTDAHIRIQCRMNPCFLNRLMGICILTVFNSIYVDSIYVDIILDILQ